MGLDITAYRQIKAAPNAAVDEEGNPEDWNRFARISPELLAFTEEQWPGRTAPLEPGIYEAPDNMRFRAGSYSGYNEWRRWLASAAGYVSPQDVWENDHKGPFSELINFSDCEGVIGATVCAKLAKDFADHADKIAPADGKDWAIKLYRQWQEAFTMAADGGYVEFH